MKAIRGHLLYVSYEFPALTQTFVRREFRELNRLGLDVRAVAMRPPGDIECMGDDASLVERCHYIGSVGFGWGLRSLVSVVLRNPARGAEAIRLLLTGRATPARRWAAYASHLLTAAFAVDSMDLSDTEYIHAHFAAGPASIAMFMSVLSGIPFGVTAHAYDLFTEQIALVHKLKHAAVFVTISEYNRRWLLDRFGLAAEAVRVVRMGVDLEEFTAGTRSEVVPGRILSVGRLEEKKGHDVLIRACEVLSMRGIEYRCSIIGDGSLRSELEALVRGLGLEDRVELTGSCSVAAVREMLRTTEVSVLACRVAKNGDMDGIPVYLMESLALGVPVVSTKVSGIPELVDDTVGVVVAPDSPFELADALELLLTNGTSARQLGANGRRRIESHFDSKVNAEYFASIVLSAIAHRPVTHRSNRPL